MWFINKLFSWLFLLPLLFDSNCFSRISVTVIVLTTMSIFNLVFWLTNADSSDRVNLSSNELITGPIWLFLKGVVTSSWYCYSVRIQPSMYTLSAATEGETLKFKYVDTNSSRYDIITANIPAFAANCGIYDTKQVPKTKLQAFLRRRNIMNGLIVVLLAIEFELPVAMLIFYAFGLDEEYNEDTVTSTTDAPNDKSSSFIYVLVPRVVK